MENWLFNQCFRTSARRIRNHLFSATLADRWGRRLLSASGAPTGVVVRVVSAPPSAPEPGSTPSRAPRPNPAPNWTSPRPATTCQKERRGNRNTMKLGVFDHMDRGLAPLDRFFEERLKLVEAYDRAGFYGYHVAEHHATPLGRGAVPGRVAGRRGAADQTAAFRPSGVSAAAVSSDQAAGRNLHARSDQRRPADAGRRPRHLADRAALLRPRSRPDPGDVCRSAGGDPARHDQPAAELRRQVLHIITTCRWR